MKKLFAGLLLGTMTIVGSTTVFAANGAEALDITTSSTAAISIEDLTPEQKAEIEKDQKEFEDKIKEVCKAAGYDYNTIMDKMQNMTLTEEEQEVLSQVGFMMSVSVPASTTAEILTPAQVGEMEKTQKEFDATRGEGTKISEAAKMVEATISTDKVEQ